MRRVGTILLALLMVLSLFACGNQTTGQQPTSPSAPPSSTTAAPEASPSAAVSSTGPEYGGTLRIVNVSEGGTPIGVPWEVFGIDTLLMGTYAEPLVLERTTGEVDPCLATEWKVDIDKLQVTFTLREGVKFTDGSDFNADVAAWNIQMAIDAKKMNPAITGVDVTSPYEIVVHLNKWSNIIVSGFASKSFAMISKEAFEKNGIEWARENPIGTGPFKLKEYIHGQSILFEKNENYWQDGKPYLDAIEYVFMRDTMTQTAALQSTGAEAIDILNTNSAELMTTLKDLDVYIDTMPIGPVSLVPSSNNPDSPLAKLEVRQAISCAIDRQALVDARGFGILTPAYQYVADTWGAHLPDSYNLSYNPDKAKELLTQAGYPNGIETTLYVMPGMVDKDIVVAMQSMLAAVGVNCTLEFPDSGGYSNYRFNGWEGMLVQHTRSFPATYNNFALYFDVRDDSPDGKLYHNNMISAWRPYDTLLAAENAAGAAPAPDDKLLQECHKIILENQVCIPLYNIYDAYVIKNNVHDTGFTKWGASTIFLPADAWKSSK
jgi:peptide/nickel transport system substrate-binding protein